MTDPTERSDEELMREAQEAPPGDLRAFELLVERHQGRVLANCRYLTGSPDDAEDLAQEVFAKAFFGLSGFEGRSKVKTWIHRIKINHCLNHLAKRRGKTFVAVDEPALASRPELRRPPRAERDLRAGRLRRRIAAVIDSMPDSLRIPLLLRDFDGLAYRDIAAALGLGLSATKMRIKRGRELFRERFEAAEAAPGAPAPEPGAATVEAGGSG